MSVDYAWYGVDGDGNVRLQARCNSTGTVTLALSDGRVLTAEADTTLIDGHARFEFVASGILAGTLTQGGVVYKHMMRIKPLPHDRLKVCHVSCNSSLRMANHAWDLINSEDVDLLVHLGDLVYSDTNEGNSMGEMTVALKTLVIRNQSPDVFRTHYRAARKWPYMMLLMSRVPMWLMWDDHEIYDGWCRGINTSNKHYIAEGAPAVEQGTTQAEIDAMYPVARTAFDEQAWTNPPNLDSGIDSDALYFRVRVGSLVEFIVPDIMTYRDLNSSLNGGSYTETRPVYADDHPDKTYLGATQKAWVLASMTNTANAGVKHIIFCSSKQPYDHNAGAANNSDTWTDCTVERDVLLDHGASLAVVPTWMSHDSHQPAVYRDPAKKLLAVNACSISSGNHHQGLGYNTHVAWKAWGNAGDPDALPVWACRKVYGLVEITPTEQIHSMKDAIYGHLVWGPWVAQQGADPTITPRTRLAL